MGTPVMAISHKYLWTTVAVLLLLILQYRLWFDDSGVVASRALERQIESLHSANDQQAQINHGLLNEVMDLRNGDALLEETAREDLGLVKEGESFILFAEPDS
ncbi:septum formation initiator family protein [Thalassolituus sp.]|jgi:cell division protein FtsB|uniref:FtsB family cell division protein n=1 Tax=Thalassolituus sp. TaxID=2030822 RepID=UPI002614B1BA|nr:septum formation initiator family protein [uncultured Thalassolituus sp.]TNC88971.1 MAG: cell division protein FtsB [Thalassolituus sp.]